MAELSASDRDQLKSRNLTPEKMEQYQQIFRKGFPPLKLAKNAEADLEIHRFSAQELEKYRQIYSQREDLWVVKFVPASGAASRMFKTLYAVAGGQELSEADQKQVTQFFEDLDKLAFFDSIRENFGDSLNSMRQSPEGQREIASFILEDTGLGYGSSPKGMVLFHNYPDGARTAFAEHFSEGAMYARKQDRVHLHFTIPAEGKEHLIQHLEQQSKKFSQATGAGFEVETSVQNQATDTPAVTKDNEFYRDETGNLFFRPAGHGALIENLNSLNADLIFIKNIDNVLPEDKRQLTVEYKQALAGYLLFLQKSVFQFLQQLDDNSLNRADCMKFIQIHFGLHLNSETDPEMLRRILNRPMRVCGMVKNSGEPGGGPFVVEDENGERSLQIVESAQINTADPRQNELLRSASHFNPVDIVAATKNYRGEKFDLLKFREDSTGIITTKSVQGQEIKALELPGLWNGAMHHWLTAFVEVPAETFNPVKTVFDLLRPAHRNDQ